MKIERAINYRRAREVSSNDGALCARARILADVYGLMIHLRAESVHVSRLNPKQFEAICIALDYMRPPS
ncbi:DUF3717 domain-containing protein [Paraburkholderia guartelaensis]|uniref:DUF3717 domain-containing protein n=1 Tax=Paraburkholderia TaxID=1822464 RepID=UPI0038BDA415